MIERNIGQTERIVRFLLGLVLLGFVIASGSFGAPQALALIAALALFWNSIFARCYLWKWLNVSTCTASKGACPGPGGDRSGA
jgi:hypothetical protein